MMTCYYRGIHFPRNRDGFIEFYTDGACPNNGSANAVAGIGVFIDEGHPENVSRIANYRTNIGAEIEAVLEAVSIIRRFRMKHVIIYTDSEFVVKGVNEWMPDWIRRGWRTASGHRPRYVKEFQTLASGMDECDIILEHVRGHSGIYGNERADELANNALD